jgi:hypothetical protein
MGSRVATVLVGALCLSRSAAIVRGTTSNCSCKHTGSTRRLAAAALVSLGLSSCVYQRAEIARTAQDQMIGLSKERVLACMRPPINRAAVGATEVWSYSSGNGRTDASIFMAGGNGFVSGTGTSRSRFCNINVVMTNGAVSRVNYSGPTGGLLTQGEQCAFAVANCTTQ